MRIIIDCDPGHDDAIALILAHQHAEVIGITTVSGNVPLTLTTANALLVMEVIGRDTPVHAGASRPLVAKPVHASHVHGESGLGSVERIAHNRAPSSEDGIAFLLETATRDTGIVALGPLTNLAIAIQRDPEWVNRIAGIFLMGGSTDVGNVTTVAEFNIYADPEAADVVFRSGAQITMCGLNVTRQIMTTDYVIERLRTCGSRAAIFSVKVLTDLHAQLELLTGRREAALHDPCAVLSATHPNLFECTPRSVTVELDGTFTRGMTVVDQRQVPEFKHSNARVAYNVHASRAMEVILQSLGVEDAS